MDFSTTLCLWIRTVSPRYSFREQLSLTSSCSESWDRLHVGASSPFWEPWVRYCTKAKQFHILFTETGFTVCATQSCPARFRSVVQEILLSWRLQPGVLPQSFLQQQDLLAVVRVPCRHAPFVLLPVEAAWGGGGIHFLQTPQVRQASSWHKQKCKLGKGHLTLRLWALWSKTGMCRLWHKGALAWLEPRPQIQMCVKTCMKFSKVHHCHWSFIAMRQTWVHADFQGEKWSALL